jgi:hypothetical protein
MKPRWTAAVGVAVLAVALLPMVASATTLPAPAPSTPTAGATVDQPLFTWTAVDGAHHYEIEVALDDQFVTVADPGDEVEPRLVHGTAYAPTLTYTAKTHYWHVRAVAADGTKGTWSAAREFTRRWTNDDEPSGDEQLSPSSRVSNFRLKDGDDTPSLDRVMFEWGAVPGASLYELEISKSSSFTAGGDDSIICKTPHRQITPYVAGQYILRGEFSECAVNSPFPPEWIKARWDRAADDSEIEIRGEGVVAGDYVVVQYLDPFGDIVGTYTQRVTSVHVAEGSTDYSFFTVSDRSGSLDESGKVLWHKPELRLEAGGTYYARVRAVDGPTGTDYPAPVYGIWSDQAAERGETAPGPLAFTPTEPNATGGDLSLPVTPTELSSSSTDVPLLSWQPVQGAGAYLVSVAIDRDFTTQVGSYLTRSHIFVPNETYDDYGPGQHYYWFATPCVLDQPDEDTVSCDVPDRLAINNPTYVGRFSKRSTPVTGMSATSRDTQTNALLRWGDALTAAQALDASYTPGGVEKYEVQITDGAWTDAVSVMTDNLAYSTAAGDPLPSGSYHWRVRPYDGQGVPLAWATGTDFTIVQPDDPDPEPSPTQSTPNPGSSTPGGLPTDPPASSGPPPTYQAPPADDGTAAEIPPDVPGKPGVKRSGKKYLRVHWRASEELGSPVSQYLVYRSTNGSSFSVVKRTTSTTVRVKASRKKSYWFYVVADSEAGRSARSSTTKFPK